MPEPCNEPPCHPVGHPGRRLSRPEFGHAMHARGLTIATPRAAAAAPQRRCCCWCCRALPSLRLQLSPLAAACWMAAAAEAGAACMAWAGGEDGERQRHLLPLPPPLAGGAQRLATQHPRCIAPFPRTGQQPASASRCECGQNTTPAGRALDRHRLHADPSRRLLAMPLLCGCCMPAFGLPCAAGPCCARLNPLSFHLPPGHTCCGDEQIWQHGGGPAAFPRLAVSRRRPHARQRDSARCQPGMQCGRMD